MFFIVAAITFMVCLIACHTYVADDVEVDVADVVDGDVADDVDVDVADDVMVM